MQHWPTILLLWIIIFEIGLWLEDLLDDWFFLYFAGRISFIFMDGFTLVILCQMKFSKSLFDSLGGWNSCLFFSRTRVQTRIWFSRHNIPPNHFFALGFVLYLINSNTEILILSIDLKITHLIRHSSVFFFCPFLFKEEVLFLLSLCKREYQHVIVACK